MNMVLVIKAAVRILLSWFLKICNVQSIILCQERYH